MAQLPPKPPLWRRRWARRVAVGLLLVALVAGAVLLSHWLRFVMQTDDSMNANTWIGLIGNVISAVLGGLAAVFVLLLTLQHERRKQSEEDRRQVIERRLDLADELGDLVGTLNLGDGMSMPEIKVASLRASRLVRKIDRTWPDQHEGRHISIALFNGARAFRESVEGGLTDRSRKWLAVALLPALESLTGSMAHRDSAIVAADAEHLLQVVNNKPM